MDETENTSRAILAQSLATCLARRRLPLFATTDSASCSLNPRRGATPDSERARRERKVTSNSFGICISPHSCDGFVGYTGLMDRPFRVVRDQASSFLRATREGGRQPPERRRGRKAKEEPRDSPRQLELRTPNNKASTLSSSSGGEKRRKAHIRPRDDAQVTRRRRLARHGALEDFDGLAERGAGLNPLRRGDPRVRRREGAWKGQSAEDGGGEGERGRT